MKEILLVDDHAMIREAIKHYLLGNKEFRVVDEAENGKEALEYLEKRSYDLVITDLSMPELSGMGLVNRIKTDFPDQSVVVLSIDYSSNTIKGLIAAGVKGYVFKNISKKDFIRSLQVVTMGGNYFSDKLALRSTPFSIHQQFREFKTLSTWKKLMVCGKLALEGATMLFF
ncbi:MAG: response regulator transcription factor [Cyclobacteriaceae bacterium]